MTLVIGTNTFDGGAVEDLAPAIRALCQHTAIVAASGVDDFTADNSGGTAGSAIANVADFTVSARTGNNAVTKVEMEAALGTVRDGLKEVVGQVNAVNAVVEAFDDLIDSMGGTAADGTIAVIDATGTGAGADLAAAAGTNTVYKALRSRVMQVAVHVNKLCYATGVAALDLNMTAAYDGEFGATLAALATDTGTAVDGSAADAANGCVLVTEFDARQAVLANAVASMAAKLDAMTADANANHVLGVVAGK